MQIKHGMQLTHNTIKREQVQCPICGSTSFEPVYETVFRVWMEGELYIWPARQVICGQCGLLFTNPQPAQNVLAAYYSNLFYFGEITTDSRIEQLEYLLATCKQTINNVFDVGSHTGVFLHLAKKYNLDVSGLEPSQEAVAIAQEKYGLRLINTFLDMEFVENHSATYDLVSVSHVLEHVPDPVQFLRLALCLVEADKYIFLEVPDASHPKSNNIAEFFSLEHIYSFSEEDFMNMASILNVEVIDISRSKAYNVLRVIYQKRNDHRPGVQRQFINNIEDKKNIVKNYASERKAFIKTIQNKIESCLDYGSEILIYGAGMHTSQLIQTGILDEYRISSVIDSDTKKIGTLFEGLTVQPADRLAEETVPVLISSYDSQEEISASLSKKFPHIRQIKLYDTIESINKGIKSAKKQ